MTGRRTYVSEFDNQRRVAFTRSRCQAQFRGEAWTLTWTEFQQFWNSRTLWARRGRSIDDLVLTRLDWEGPWSRDNCCIITRGDHLIFNAKHRSGQDISELLSKAKKYESL